MKKVMCAALMLAFCTGFAYAQEGMSGEQAPCDMKKVEKAKYCETCHLADPKLDDKGNCGMCNGKVTDADVCVKEYWMCTCGKVMAKQGTCCKDGKVAKEVDKARIVFTCEGCGAPGEKEGDCTNEACKKAGKKIKKTCEKSGLWPHGGEEPKN